MEEADSCEKNTDMTFKASTKVTKKTIGVIPMFTVMNTKFLKQLQPNQNKKLKECWKSIIEVQCVKSQPWDKSNKVLVSKDFKWSKGLSTSSKVWLFHSFHTNHIRYPSTKFQTFKESFPYQFCQPKRREMTLSSITHWTPNIWNTTLNSARPNSQCSKRWSTDSPQHRHIQHRLTRVKPLLTRLSIARIQPHTAVHKTKQKDTLLGALTPQTLFQGKEIVSVPQIAQWGP